MKILNLWVSAIHVTTAVGLKRVPTALAKMSRPVTIPQSAILTTCGAVVALDRLEFSHDFFLTTALSAGTCATSMIINDLVDANRGTDANKKTNQIVAGNISKNEVVFFLVCAYATELCGIYALESISPKCIVSFALFLTVIYTHLLKPVTWLKNVSVAGIVASTPIAGAVSVKNINISEDWPLFQMSAMIFFIIFHKEILMDVEDYADDKNSGIITVPVKYGKKNAILVSTSLLTSMMTISHSNIIINACSIIMLCNVTLVYLDEKYLQQLFSNFKYLSAIMILTYTMS